MNQVNYAPEVRQRGSVGVQARERARDAVGGDPLDGQEDRLLGGVVAMLEHIRGARQPGLTTDQRKRMKEQKREIRELRRAKESLRKASALFAQAELDRRPKTWSRSSTSTVPRTGSSISARWYQSRRRRSTSSTRASRPARGKALVHHSDAGSRNLSIRYTGRLVAAGIEQCIATVGDSFDQAAATSSSGHLDAGGRSPPVRSP